MFVLFWFSNIVKKNMHRMVYFSLEGSAYHEPLIFTGNGLRNADYLEKVVNYLRIATISFAVAEPAFVLQQTESIDPVLI